MKKERGNFTNSKKTSKIFVISFFVVVFIFGVWMTYPDLLMNSGNYSNTHGSIGVSEDTSFEYLWNTTWGTVDRELGRDIVVDSSGNVYITGKNSTMSAMDAFDAFIIKYDNNSSLLWNVSIGDDDNEESGSAIAVDDSGNVYIVGFLWNQSLHDYDTFLVKFDSSGIQQWYTLWSGNGNDRGQGVALDDLGHVYIVGWSNSYTAGNYNAFCAKFNVSNGVQLWNTTWGGSENELGYGIALNSAGDIYISGSTTSFSAGFEDMFLVKYDDEGTQQWNETWGTVQYDRSADIALDSDENVYIVGESLGFGAHYCPVLVKYDPSGTQLWNVTKSFPSASNTKSVVVDSSGVVHITGDFYKSGSNYDAFIASYDDSGTLVWETTWGDLEAENCYGIAVDSDGDLFITGETQSFGEGDYDVYIVKFGLTEPNPPPPIPKVPGYSTWAIIALVSVIVLIKIRRHKK